MHSDCIRCFFWQLHLVNEAWKQITKLHDRFAGKVNISSMRRRRRGDTKGVVTLVMGAALAASGQVRSLTVDEDTVDDVVV
jgi:hypothetical protein